MNYVLYAVPFFFLLIGITIYAAMADESVDQVLARFAGQGFGAFKPALGELLARLRAACRRPTGGQAAPAIRVGRIDFDAASREVRVGGEPLVLPRRELALLELLVQRAGRVVQRGHLDSELYGFGVDVSPNALETQVSRLRRRLQDVDAGVEVQTIRGVGYMLRPC